MRLIPLLLLALITNTLSAQYSEELVEILYKEDKLVSIAVLPEIVYLDQMRGGVDVNTEKNLYTFTGISNNGDSKIYSLDITTGEIKHEILAPEIRMIHHTSLLNNTLVGLHKSNSGIVSLGWLNYTTGALTNNSPQAELENLVINTHNGILDDSTHLYYHVGSIPGTNEWQIFTWDVAMGIYVGQRTVNPANKSVLALSVDAQRKKLIGLLEITSGALSLIEIEQFGNSSMREIKRIDDLKNTFGGHRYWAYNDIDDELFVIGQDQTGESFLFVLDSNTGAILYQNPYEDDAWIMEEHSPLELCYSHGTKQLLGLRKGEPLSTATYSLAPQQDGIKVFPNPIIQQEFKAELTNANELIKELTLFSLDGKPLFHQTPVGRNSINISLPEISSGLYFLLVISEKGVYRQSVLMP